MNDKSSPEVTLLSVTNEEDNFRIDKLLALRYPELSRQYFQGLIESADVLLNGQPTLKRKRVAAGNSVEVCFKVTPEIDLKPENIPLDIIFEDEDIIAVNKPAGMTVHPAPGNWTGTFVNALVYHCGNLEGDFHSLRPGIVHRLDKDTSGLMIAAKTKRAHLRLAELFAERRIYKEYLAVCLGNSGNGTIENQLDRHPIDRKKRTVVEQGGKTAISHFETLVHSAKLCLVKIAPKTGRTHQIRVHMLFHGTPVLGDTVYGNAQANKRWGLSRQLLHAHRLVFEHPFTKEPMDLRAPLHPDMEGVLTQLPKVELK